jgi:hypothetical protein
MLHGMVSDQMSATLFVSYLTTADDSTTQEGLSAILRAHQPR